MKKAAWFALMAATAVYGQIPSENVAVEALKERMLKMNLLNPPRAAGAGPSRVLPNGPVRPQTVCSIPLLNAIPPGNLDKMAVEPKIPAQATSRDEIARVPAPACDQGLFTNR
jgi:hypothetical protein